MKEIEDYKKDVVSYYEDTGLDYGEWSRKFNMHFGYYRFPMNPFRREPMLEAMNQEAFRHLHLGPDDKLIYDLGCGLGAPSRSLAASYPDKKVTGITIVPWQIEKANTLNPVGEVNKPEFVLGDFTQLPFPDNSADGVFALESSCHCEGLDKAAVVKEMLRVLKPGKRFVIIDGFIMKEPHEFNRLLRYSYDEVCKGWALPSFPHLGLMRKALEENGAEVLEVKNLSYRVAPSVLHAPFCVSWFLLKKLIQGEKLNPIRKGHLKACLLGLILGMHSNCFSYGLISGIKRV